MDKAIIFDTETTGIDDPEIIEAAWIEPQSFYDFSVKDDFNKRFKPSKPISLSAMAVHHIMDEDLENNDPSSSFSLPSDIDYLIGHNVDFDWKAAGHPEVKRICTLALCRHFWPDLESHTQSVMIYYLCRLTARNRLQGKAHSALSDVENCILILGEILAINDHVESWEELWDLSEMARIPTKMTFGKHKGMAIKDVPADYKRWLMKQPDTDQYLLKAIQS